MNELTIKERILKLLLESPKTTGEIAKKLGYVDKKGMGKYNNVKADLNTLQSSGFIHYSKTKKQGIPGPAPTTYDIVYEISKLRELLNKYPSLISDFQKSDKILSMLANKEHYIAFSHNVKELPNRDFFELLKDMLSCSQCFFDNCLKPGSFLTQWGMMPSQIKQHNIIPLTTSMTDKLTLDAIMMSFWHCVIDDYLKGVSTNEEINLVNTIKRGYIFKDGQFFTLKGENMIEKMKEIN